MERETHSHPSFGQLYFGRVQSTGTEFYGSELRQDNYITMDLSSSKIQRDLSKDWHFADKSLVRVRMSSAQFAEAITNMNCGGGVCCTIEYLPNEKIAELPKQESRKELMSKCENKK